MSRVPQQPSGPNPDSLEALHALAKLEARRVATKASPAVVETIIALGGSAGANLQLALFATRLTPDLAAEILQIARDRVESEAARKERLQ